MTCTATDSDAVNSPVSVSFTVTVVPVLSLAQPANVAVDATSGHGAVVSYGAPAVSGVANPSPPAAICSPASGSTFAIGPTTVSCKVSDAAAVPAQATVSFTVTVKGAAAQLTDLGQSVQGLSHGKVLAAPVAAAASALAAGHPLLASLDLDGFIALVVVLQHAGAIPAATAQALIADAVRIISVVGASR